VTSESSNHGTGGASARREHERRKGRREQAVRDKHPRIGGLLLALSEPPAHERGWAHGAGGEEMVAAALDEQCRPDVVVLHDRAIAGSRANIDHIAVGPAGVWVIDTKRYKGKIDVAKPLFGSAKLKVGGRDRSKLVAGLAKQIELVAPVAAAVLPDVPVRGAFCFVQGDLPLLRTLSINGFPLLHRRSLLKRLNAGGPLGSTASLSWRSSWRSGSRQPESLPALGTTTRAFRAKR
jgi:nuclease-like protein